MDVRLYSSLDELPVSYDGLFANCAKESFFQSQAWFRCLLATCVDPGDRVRLYGVEGGPSGHTPLALYVMRVPNSAPGFSNARVLSGFENYYTMKSGPLFSSEASDRRKILQALFGAIAEERPTQDVLSLRMLDHGTQTFEDVSHALRANGMVIHPYFQYGNWFENTQGMSYKDYLSARGVSIKRTLARKARKLTQSGEMSLKIIVDEDGLEEAIDIYKGLYAQSWKGAELYPVFVPELIRACARAGTLRLGNLYLNGTPVATKFVVSSGRTATLYKSAYTTSVPASLSVGGVLTLHVLQYVLDVDKVSTIDLGNGDEPYKAHWVTRRNERWGLMAFNPRTARGAIATIRHSGAARVKSAIQALGIGKSPVSNGAES